ncbi:MAG TPA: hypothetical protein DDZ51_10080 [Planctomycetaceae bacterium]|nr:hypothetical protein [Planctomycetaceae bacterium]
MNIETSAFGTLPTVIFQRLDVRDGTPTSTHAIVFESVAEAKAEAARIATQDHLRLLAADDAVVRPRSSQPGF